MTSLGQGMVSEIPGKTGTYGGLPILEHAYLRSDISKSLAKHLGATLWPFGYVLRHFRTILTSLC